jgi:hypothetical protein
MSNLGAILNSTVEFLLCEDAFGHGGWRENESVGSFVGFYDILRDAGMAPIGLRLDSFDDEVNLLLDRFPDSPKFRKNGPSGRYLFFFVESRDWVAELSDDQMFEGVRVFESEHGVAILFACSVLPGPDLLGLQRLLAR